MSKIDLSRFIGSKYFILLYIILKNGICIPLTTFADSRANGFAFINITYIIDIAKFFNLKAKHFIRPINTKGFNGRPGKLVTHFLSFNLSLDGQRQEDILFLILDLGSYNMILGLKWIFYFNIWLNPRDKRLLWPDDPERTIIPSFQREIKVPRNSLKLKKPNQKHQRDANTRDRAIELENIRDRANYLPGIVSRRILLRPTAPVKKIVIKE